MLNISLRETQFKINYVLSLYKLQQQPPPSLTHIQQTFGVATKLLQMVGWQQQQHVAFPLPPIEVYSLGSSH